MDTMDQCKCCRRVHTNITLNSTWITEDEDDDEEFLKAALDIVDTEIAKDASLSWFDDLTERKLLSSSPEHTAKLSVCVDAEAGDSSGLQNWSPCPRGGRCSSPSSDIRCGSSVTPVTDPLSLVFDGGTPSITGLERTPQDVSSPSLEQLANNQSDVKWTSAMATPFGYSTSFNNDGTLSMGHCLYFRSGYSYGSPNPALRSKYDTSLGAGDITVAKVKLTHRKLFSPVMRSSHKPNDSLLHLSDLDITKDTDVTILQEDEGADRVEAMDGGDENNQTLKSSAENAGTQPTINSRDQSVSSEDGVEKREHIETLLNSLFGSPTGLNGTGSNKDIDNERSTRDDVEFDSQSDDKYFTSGVGSCDGTLAVSNHGIYPSNLESSVGGIDKERNSDNCCDDAMEPDHMSDSLCLSALLDGEKSLKNDRDTGIKNSAKKRDGATKKLFQNNYSANDATRSDLNVKSNKSPISSNMSNSVKPSSHNDLPIVFASTPSICSNKAILTKSKSERKARALDFSSAVNCNPLSILKSPNTPKSNYSRKVRFSLPSGSAVASSFLSHDSTTSDGKDDVHAHSKTSHKLRGHLDEEKANCCNDIAGILDDNVQDLESKECGLKIAAASNSNLGTAVPCVNNDTNTAMEAESHAKCAESDMNSDSRIQAVPIHGGNESKKVPVELIKDSCSTGEDSLLPPSPTFCKEVPSVSNSLEGVGNRGKMLPTISSGDTNCVKDDNSCMNYENGLAVSVRCPLSKKKLDLSRGDVSVKNVVVPTSFCSLKFEKFTGAVEDPVDNLLMAAYDVSGFGDVGDVSCSATIQQTTNPAAFNVSRLLNDNTKVQDLKEGEGVSHSSLPCGTLSHSSVNPLLPLTSSIPSSLQPSSHSDTVISTTSVITNPTTTDNSSISVINRSLSSSLMKNNLSEISDLNSSDLVTISNSVTSSSVSLPVSLSSTGPKSPNSTVTVSSASNVPLLSTGSSHNSFNLKQRKFFYPKATKMPEADAKNNSTVPEKTTHEFSSTTASITSAPASPTVSVTILQPSASHNEDQVAISCNNGISSESNVDHKSDLFWSKEAQHLFDDDDRITGAVEDVLSPSSAHKPETERQVEDVSNQTSKNNNKRKGLPKLLGFARFSDMFGNKSTESETNKEGSNMCSGVNGVGFQSHPIDSTTSLTSSFGNVTSVNRNAVIVSPHARKKTSSSMRIEIADVKRGIVIEQDSHCIQAASMSPVCKSDISGYDNCRNYEIEKHEDGPGVISVSNVRNKGVCGDIEGKGDDDREMQSHLEGISSHEWEMTEFSQMTPNNNLVEEKSDIANDEDQISHIGRSNEQSQRSFGDDVSHKFDKNDEDIKKSMGFENENNNTNCATTSILHQENAKHRSGGLKRTFDKSHSISSCKKLKLENSSETLSAGHVSKLKSFDELFFSNELSADMSETNQASNVEDEFEKVLAGLNDKSSFTDKSRQKDFTGFQKASESNKIGAVIELPDRSGEVEKDMEEEFDNVLASLKNKSRPLNANKRSFKETGDFKKCSSTFLIKTGREVSKSSKSNQEIVEDVGLSENAHFLDKSKNMSDIENQFENMLAGVKGNSSSLQNKNKRKGPVIPTGNALLSGKDSFVDQFENVIAGLERKDHPIVHETRGLSDFEKGYSVLGKEILKTKDNVKDRIQPSDEMNIDESFVIPTKAVKHANVLGLATYEVADVDNSGHGRKNDDEMRNKVEKPDSKVQVAAALLDDIFDSEESERLLKGSKNYCLQSEEFCLDSDKTFDDENFKGGFQTAAGKEIKLSVEAKKKANDLWDSANSESVVNSMPGKLPGVSLKVKENVDVALQGFCTARGKEIKLSEEARRKACNLWDSACSENNIGDSKFELSELEGEESGVKGVSPLQGFVTAGGGKIVLSEGAEEKAKCLWESVGSGDASVVNSVEKGLEGVGYSNASTNGQNKDNKKSLEAGVLKGVDDASSSKRMNCSRASRPNQHVDTRHKGFRPFMPPKLVKKRKMESASCIDVGSRQLDDQSANLKQLDLREPVDGDGDFKLQSGEENINDSTLSNAMDLDTLYSEKALENVETSLNSVDVSNRRGESLQSELDGNSCQVDMMDESVDELMKCVEEQPMKGVTNDTKNKLEENTLEARRNDECHFDDEFDCQLLAELDLKSVSSVYCNRTETVEGNHNMEFSVACMDTSIKTPVDKDKRSVDEKGACDGKENEKLSSVHLDGRTGLYEEKDSANSKKNQVFGFSTAAGSVVTVSDKALKKARSFLNEDDDTSLIGSRLDGGNFSVYGLNDSDNSKRVDGFCTATGSKVSASEKAIEKAKKSCLNSSDEEMMKIDDNGDMTGNWNQIDSLKDKTFSGFSTAAGTEVSVSESALEKVRSFLNAEGSVTGSKDTSLSERDGKSVKPFLGFTTAAGSTVSVSEKALKKAKNFLNDDATDAGASMITTCHDQDKSEDIIKDQSRTDFSAPPGSVVKDCGKTLNNAHSLLNSAVDNGNILTDGNLKDQSKNNHSRHKHPIGFSTAAGEEVLVSEKAMAQARSFLNDDEDVRFTDNIDQGRDKCPLGKLETVESKNLSGFSTAAGSKVSVSEESLAKVKSLLNENDNANSSSVNKLDVGKSKFAGFSTASGLDVSISKASLEHARAFLNDDCGENTIVGTCMGESKQNVEEEHIVDESRNPSAMMSSEISSDICIPMKALEQAEMLLLGKENKRQNAGGLDNREGNEDSIRGPVIPGESPHLAGSTAFVTKTKQQHCYLHASKKTPLISKSEEVLNDRPGTKRRRLRAVHSNGLIKEQRLPLLAPSCSHADTSIHSKPPFAITKTVTKPTPTSTQHSSFIPPASTSHSGDHKGNSSTTSSEDNKTSTESSSNKHPVFFSKSKWVQDSAGVRRSSRLKSTPDINNMSYSTCPNQTSKAIVHDADFPSLQGRLDIERKTKGKKTNVIDQSVNVEYGDKGGVLVLSTGGSNMNQKEIKSVVNATQQENMIVDDELNDEEENKFLCENISTQIGFNKDVLVEKTDETLSTVVVDTERANGRSSSYQPCVEGLKTSNKVGSSNGVYQRGRYYSNNMGSSIDGACDSTSGGAALLDGTVLAEARMRQEKVIRDKKRRRIMPRHGRLTEQRKATTTMRGGERFDLRSLDGEKMTRDELLGQGVSGATLFVNSGNAADFRFDLRRFYPGGVPACVLVGDGASLVHDGQGFAGCHEFYKAFLTLDGVDPNLVDETWVRNHYRWIVWKLAAYEINFPSAFAGRALTPHSVMLQLKYRCDREVDSAQRSAIKKIVEKDDTSTKRIVLCVAGVKKDDNGQAIWNRISISFSTSRLRGAPFVLALRQYPSLPIARYTPKVLLEMTDGWYSIWSKLDPPLSNLVSRSRLSVGVKVITSGAELEGAGQGCPPLEMGEDVRLSLRANSTRPAPWFSRLGFQSNPMALCVPLSSLLPDGGVLGCVDVVISRIYPTMFMEKQEDGKCVFRTQEEEDEETKKHSERRQREVERIYHSLQVKMEEEEEKRNNKVKRRAWSRREVEELSSGEELMNAWETSFSQEDFQMMLSEDQLRKLLDHRQECVAERQARLSHRVRESIGDNDTYRDRRVMPVQKLRVVGCCNKDIDLQCECMLTVWRPSVDWCHVQEGQRYRMFHLAVSPSRCSGAYLQHSNTSRVALASTRQTRIQKLHIGDNLLDLVYQPGELLTVRELSSLDSGSEFDFLGVALKVEPPSGCDGGGNGQGRPLLITSVDKHGDVMVIKTWRRSQSIISSVKESQCFVALNLMKCKTRINLLGRRETATAEARQETTSFSTSMGCKHGKALAELREHLAKTPTFLEKARQVLDQQSSDSLNDESVSNAIRTKSPVPCTSLDGWGFSEDYEDDFPPEIVDNIFHRLTPNGSLRPSPRKENLGMATQQDTQKSQVLNQELFSTAVVVASDDSHGECVQDKANGIDDPLAQEGLMDEKRCDKVESSENKEMSTVSVRRIIHEARSDKHDNGKGLAHGEDTKGCDVVCRVDDNIDNKGDSVRSDKRSGMRSRLKRKRPIEGMMDRDAGDSVMGVKVPAPSMLRPKEKGTLTMTGGNVSVSEETESTAEEGDLVLRKRKKNLRDKMNKLLSYGKPQSLTPLPGAVVSPACVKQFKSPHSSSLR